MILVGCCLPKGMDLCTSLSVGACELHLSTHTPPTPSSSRQARFNIATADDIGELLDHRTQNTAEQQSCRSKLCLSLA